MLGVNALRSLQAIEAQGDYALYSKALDRILQGQPPADR
jgi:hypothetical protein